MPYDSGEFARWLGELERRLDPAALLTHFVRAEADPWQAEAVSSTSPILALNCMRQSGKSCVLATRGVMELQRGGTTICLAPAERQTREITRKVTTYLRDTDLVVERATQTEIEVNSGGRFIAVPASGATIRGYTADLLMEDEAAYLPGHNGGEEVIVAVLPMLKDDGQVIYASTPAGKGNFFAGLFLKPKPGVHRITVRGTDLPRMAGPCRPPAGAALGRPLPAGGHVRVPVGRPRLLRPRRDRARDQPPCESSGALMQIPTILADGTAVLPTPDPGVVTVKGFSRYILGVDLAASVDNTALVLIRDEQLPEYMTTIRQGLGPRRRTVVWADKFKGVSYPDIVQHVTGLLMRPQLVGKTRLVIDATGLGQVVSQLFTEQQVPHIAATTTAGYEHALNGSKLSVPKNLLVETLAVGFSSGDLTFAHDLPLRQDIEEELQTFTLTTTAAGNQIITQSRANGSHGDLAIALALAFFVSARCQPQRMAVGKLTNWY